MNDPETLKYFPAYLSFSSFLLSSLFSSLLYTSHLSTLSLSCSGFRKCFQPTKCSRKKIPAWTLLWKWTFMELRNNRIVSVASSLCCQMLSWEFILQFWQHYSITDSIVLLDNYFSTCVKSMLKRIMFCLWMCMTYSISYQYPFHICMGSCLCGYVCISVCKCVKARYLF